MALEYNIDSREIENLVWAFQHLRTQEFVGPQRVGLGGFCVGASFALVAATDPRIRDQVAFVNVFGPYYDAHDLLLQLASRSRFYRGQTEPWEPDPLTLRVFANELVESVEDPRERELLRDLLDLRVQEGQEFASAEPIGLSRQGQAVYRLLRGTTLEEAKTLNQALPLGFHQDMERISPSTYVAELSTRLLIIHDRDDRLIPVGESRRLAEAVESRGNFRYTEVLAFRHVRPETGLNLWQLAREGYKLYRHMYDIILVAA
jgi:pimeloyl-ACP methyl ester carboxylesterase